MSSADQAELARLREQLGQVSAARDLYLHERNTARALLASNNLAVTINDARLAVALSRLFTHLLSHVGDNAYTAHESFGEHFEDARKLWRS